MGCARSTAKAMCTTDETVAVFYDYAGKFNECTISLFPIRPAQPGLRQVSSSFGLMTNIAQQNRHSTNQIPFVPHNNSVFQETLAPHTTRQVTFDRMKSPLQAASPSRPSGMDLGPPTYGLLRRVRSLPKQGTAPTAPSRPWLLPYDLR